MSITHEAYLNIVPGDSPAPIIKVSQYDADFSIVFHLIAKKRGIVPAYPRTVENDEDVTINVPTSATVSVRGTKTDGNGYSANATLSGTVTAPIVTVTGHEQMTASAGVNVYEITFYADNATKRLSTANFILFVEPAALDASTITSESLMLELNDLIASVPNAVAAAERAEAAAAQFEIDDTLTQQGKPADAKKVGDEISGIKADLNELIGGDEQQAITFIKGKYINTGSAVEVGGTVDITNLAEWYSLKHAIVECQPGDEFLLDMVGATNARAYAFLTSNNVLISRSDAGQTITGKIVAPANAGKVIIQGIYRQTQDDTTTDNGTAYKLVQGTGNVVRFDIVQNKTEAEKARARENIGITSGEGLSNEAKVALLNCFAHVAWVDEHGQDYYDALERALYEEQQQGLSVVLNLGKRNIYAGDSFDRIKSVIAVSDISSGETVLPADYNISGSVAEGSQIFTITSSGKTGRISIPIYPTPYSYSITDLTVEKAAGLGPNLSYNDASRRRAVSLPRGRYPYYRNTDSSDILNVYPIPVPADATGVTVTVPSGFYVAFNLWYLYPYGGYALWQQENSWAQTTNSATFASSEGLSLNLNIKYGSAGSSIPTEPEVISISFSK